MAHVWGCQVRREALYEHDGLLAGVHTELGHRPDFGWEQSLLESMGIFLLT